MPQIKVVKVSKKKLIVSDVVPLSIGVAKSEKGGQRRKILDKLIKAGSAMPLTIEKKYQTSYDNQRHIKIALIQGDEYLAADNHKLGEFSLNGIP